MADAEVADRGDNLVDPVVENDDVTIETPEVPETPETKVETPEAKTPERDDSGRFIPKGRFDEAVSKERAARETAERKLAELQSSLRQVDRNADTAKLETEIVGLEQQHSKLLLDGDHERAAALMTQIRLKERTISIQEATHLSAQAKNEAREEVRMDAAIDSLETNYNVLNPNHESFDQELIDFVLSVKDNLILTERLSPSAALVKAAQKVMAKMAPKAAEPAAAKGLGAAKGGAQDRKKTQLDKNLDTIKKQPADLKDVGIDSDQVGIKGDVDVTKLTYDEFSALPASTKARLRGDSL